MADTAIRVENIYKRYRIGATIRHDTLREQLSYLIRRPFGRTHPQPSQDSRSFWALEDLSFEVERGEVLGVIGRNGAGKSTLLKILSRITRPTRGRVELIGRVGSLLEVGTGFHPELTGRENVYMNGSILGMSRAEIKARFDQIVDFAGIETFLDTPVKRYSSGMYIRLAFAVAAHLEPDILLIDEVLAVGDIEFQQKCLRKMNSISEEGRTVVFVSHNMSAVRNLCTRAILLDRGKVQSSGDVEDVLKDYFLLTDMPSSTTVDLSEVARNNVAYGQDLRITSLRVETSPDEDVLSTGSPLQLTMEFVVNKPLVNVGLGNILETPEGVRLFHLRTTDSMQIIPELKPGKYTARCCVAENPLMPGIYSVTVGAMADTRSLDYIPKAMAFRVAPTKKFDVSFQPILGSLHVDADWTLDRQSQLNGS